MHRRPDSSNLVATLHDIPRTCTVKKVKGQGHNVDTSCTWQSRKLQFGEYVNVTQQR